MTARVLQALPSQAAASHSRSAPEPAWLPSHSSRAEGESGIAAPERRIAELEALVGELDAYTGSVAHDLRAPMRAVGGYARALEEDYGVELPRGALDFVTKIIGAAHEMDRMIVDLLALSRADVPAAAMSHVDTSEIVSLALEDLAPQLTDRVRVMVGELRECRGHAGLLQHVWTNLLSNALKFTRERDPGVIEIGSSEAEGVVTWFVRDNGAGFDPAQARDLFLPFRRLHDARQYEGHGIGLAIVRRIVKCHGGRVWADARPGEGASFCFTLSRR